MKTFKITASNGKGLSVNGENISDIVKRETPVKFKANDKEIIVFGFNARDFHRKDSCFEYFVKGVSTNMPNVIGSHGLQCADLKALLGFEKDTKNRVGKPKVFSYSNLEMATELELIQLRDAILAELKRREDAKQNKIAELEKELARLKAL